ncbi:MAG: NYN domain-containing protein [Chloroflexota bacterium]|jgi:hypothetical protein
MTNDVAILLDLDNIIIGAKQANLSFDINLILDHIKEITNGRIVLRRSYGDWRQSRDLLKDLTTAGFLIQSTVRINTYSKNLADMQIVVDTMDTLIDGHNYNVYVLITGDRDFTPLVQSLRKRGKQVIGVGVRHTASRSFVSLCDQYIFYESLISSEILDDGNVETLLQRALDRLLANDDRGQASVLKQYMLEMSSGAFENTPHAESSFRKFLTSFPHILAIEQEDTTIYVRRPDKTKSTTVEKTKVSPPKKVPTSTPDGEERALHQLYQTGLKKQKLRIVDAKARFTILFDMIQMLSVDRQYEWRQLLEALYDKYSETPTFDISKNMINATMLLARQAGVIRTLKGRSLSTAPVVLEISTPQPFKDAILHCDAVYLREILALTEPFDIQEASLALYDSPKYVKYLQKNVMNRVDKIS